MGYVRRQGFVERGLRRLTPAAPILGGLTFYVLGYGLGFSGSLIDQVTNFVQNLPNYMNSGYSSISISASIEQAKYVGNVVSKPMAAGGAVAAWKVYKSFVDGFFGRS